MHHIDRFLLMGAAASLIGSGVLAETVKVRVTIDNLAPANGTNLTPVWVGFHDGTFDSYDGGSPASAALERLAEDGNTGPISDLFMSSGVGAAQGVVASSVGIPPIQPGESGSQVFTVESTDPAARYLSYVSMIIPSNDAFIANGDPIAHPVFDAGGAFLGVDFMIMGGAVNDAGTEVNDELPMNTAFFGQMTPDTGTPEGGVVHAHPGFMPAGSGGILDDPAFANADFTIPGYPIARVRVTLVQPVRVRVVFENLAPEFGTNLTPPWIGLHDGTFDTYDGGVAASAALERLAEDGNTGPLGEAFMTADAGSVQGTIIADQGIPIVQFGETATMEFDVDALDPRSRYFSYVSMIVPSNDAFVANGNPLAHAIFTEDGTFLGTQFMIMGGAVNDAGTEVNDELPMNTAFFGQMTPDTGTPEGGVVHAHPGFMPVGSGGILDDPAFMNADFTTPGYVIGRVTVELAGGCDTDIALGDGMTDMADIAALLANWGGDGPGADLAMPMTVIDSRDLAVLLSNFGACR